MKMFFVNSFTASEGEGQMNENKEKNEKGRMQQIA
jgi:hypothetical protein